MLFVSVCETIKAVGSHNFTIDLSNGTSFEDSGRLNCIPGYKVTNESNNIVYVDTLCTEYGSWSTIDLACGRKGMALLMLDVMLSRQANFCIIMVLPSLDIAVL